MKIYKIAQFHKVCPECEGKKWVKVDLQNRGTLNWVEHTERCPTCNGKGFVDQTDLDHYNHDIGIRTCPECKK